jgi:hypothetical protein
VRRNAIALAAAVLVSACGTAPTGTDVQRLSLDLAFGLHEVKAAPANFGPVAPADERPSDDITLPGVTVRTPLNAQIPCPEAALNAFPAREAGFNVDALPRAGLSRWRREGTQTLTAVPGITLPVGGFETRAVRRVTAVSDARFTYQTVQPGSAQQTVVTTWTVNTAATSTTVNTVAGPSARTGDPERGLVLSKVDTYDAKGKPVGTFAPSPGILILPLPVVAGEQWTAAGLDPSTGQVLQHQGTVRGRERVDACGDVIDGWRVDGSETLQNAAGVQAGTRTYNYIVATQLGGIVILEDVDGQTPDGTLKAKFWIGQLEPFPLPQELA